MIKQFDLVQKTQLAEYERVGLSLVAAGYVRFRASCFFTAKAADFDHDMTIACLFLLGLCGFSLGWSGFHSREWETFSACKCLSV